MKSTVSIFSQRELLLSAAESVSESQKHNFRVMPLKQGEVLFREGERDEIFYVLMSGRLEAHSEGWDLDMTEILPGRTLGEAAILTGRPYVATVTAAENSIMLAISRGAFYRLIESKSELEAYFRETIAPRIHRSYLTEILTKLFGNLSNKFEEHLQQHVSWLQLETGDILFNEGEPGDALYIVVAGRLKVVISGDDRERVIGTIHHGEMVGEMALLTDSPRSATIRAARETHLVRLDREDFDTLVHDYPDALLNITRTIITRQQKGQHSHNNAGVNAQSFAVVFLDDRTPGVFDTMLDTFTTDDNAQVFNAMRFDTHYGQSGVAQTNFSGYLNLIVTRWMTELEMNHRYVFWVADSEWTNWTQRCLRNADRLLLVGSSIESPERRAIEAHIERHFPGLRADLILLHPPETEQPAGTRAWLEARKVFRHHHIRRGDAGHIARVARHLSGRAYGLALSGGGATALAHIGVKRALEQLGIPVDMIGGTSMGAIIGAGMALGYGYDDMLELVDDFGHTGAISDPTAPFVSLLKSKKITALFKQFFAKIQIEDLWIPFFCVSSNLTQSEVHVHDAGTLWEAIRTTASLPVVTVPVSVGDDLHVDGGVMNNFPVDIMHARIEGGPIIGIMVSPLCSESEEYDDLAYSVSGWRALWRRLNPFADPLKVPAIMDTLFRTMQVNSRRHFLAVHELADLSIVMHDNHYRFYELDKHAEIIQHGYDASFEPLKLWWDEQKARQTSASGDEGVRQQQQPDEADQSSDNHPEGKHA